MSNKIKEMYYTRKKVINNILFILTIPFLLIVINLLTNTIFNLGVYTGTFMRFLYDIVTY